MEKQKIVAQFIEACDELGLSNDEKLELAAHSLIAAVSATGKTYATIEVDGVGSVEVEC